METHFSVFPGHARVVSMTLRDFIHSIQHVLDGAGNVPNDEKELGAISDLLRNVTQLLLQSCNGK